MKVFYTHLYIIIKEYINEGFLYAFIYYYKRIDKHEKFIKFIVLCTEAPYSVFSCLYFV